MIFFANEFGDRAIAGSGLEGIPYSERSSLIMPFIRIVLLSLCLFFMLTSLPFALVWLFLKLVGATKGVRHLAVRVAPLLATLAFWIVPLCFLNLNGSQIGTFNRWTAGILFGTFFFPLLSITGLVLVLRVPNDEIHRGCCVVTGFLLSWHLLALRLWAAL